MVARFHEAGLEVILDVVYNHTAEGNERGPTLSFKGIDNASYYRLLPDKPRYYINDTGTGNTLNLSHHARASRWSRTASVIGRPRRMSTASASISAPSWRGSRTVSTHQSGFLKACCQDPVLGAVKLIAEPWDCGPGGYQVGGFPPGWAEWNDRFRDTARDFWKGEAPAASLAARLCASGDVFNHRGRKPWASVNFIAAHDGFTLERPGDLRREAQRGQWRGQQRRQLRQPLLELRRRRADRRPGDQRAARPADPQPAGTLLLSQGTPMLLAGDEFGRTQKGNNNAYCQDNEISWVDWAAAEKGAAHPLRPEADRAARPYPILRRGRFLTGQYSKALEAIADWSPSCGKLSRSCPQRRPIRLLSPQMS